MDPNAVLQHSGALLLYYAPAALTLLTTVAWPIYIKPTIDAIISLPPLIKEQNDLLRQQIAKEQAPKQP